MATKLKDQDNAEYQAFKERQEYLLQSNIPIKFRAYNLKDLVSKKECKEAGIKKILETIESKYILNKVRPVGDKT